MAGVCHPSGRPAGDVLGRERDERIVEGCTDERRGGAHGGGRERENEENMVMEGRGVGVEGDGVRMECDGCVMEA